MPVERRVSKWLWISLVVLVIAGMVFASFSNDHPEWEEARRWVAERRVAWLEDGCPVVSGAGNEGCSRGAYREAALAASKSSDVNDRIRSLADGEAPAEDALLSATSSAVALLRNGAHRLSDVAPDEPRLGEHAESSVIDVESLLVAFAALQLHARRLAPEDPEGAADLLLDGLVAAVDLASAGIGIERLVGQLAAKNVIDEFTDGILRRCCDRELGGLAGALERVDAALPVSDDLVERTLAHQILYFEEVETVRAEEVHPAGLWAAWRHGFSMRSHAIAKTCRQLDLMRRARELAAPRTSSWASRKAALQWFEDELGKLPRDFLSIPRGTDFEQGSRSTSTALGQLRQAIAFHRRQPVPEFPDRLGDGAIQVEISGDDAVFRSVEPELVREALRAPR